MRDVPPPEDVTYSDPIFDLNIEDEEETARVKEVIKIWSDLKPFLPQMLLFKFPWDQNISFVNVN